MRVSILSIGDELTFGEIADTNAAHISARLYDSGVKVGVHHTVGDVEGDLVHALHLLSEQNDFVVATGGLGPTVDDITAAAVAAALSSPLVENGEALLHVREMACKLGGDLTGNRKQALLPHGSTVIPNPVGTACGFSVQFGTCEFFFLPGVPKEMARMLGDTVLPHIIRSRKEANVLVTKVLKVFGIAEATVDALLGDVEAGEGVTIAYAVQFPEISIKIRAEGEGEKGIRDRLRSVSAQVRSRIENYLFAEDDDTIDTVVARLLREKRATVSLAESCTGGLVAKRLTDLAGSSAYFLEGAVTYSNAAKTRTLKVPEHILEKHGAVSDETAVAMATGMRDRAATDVAVAITGIAGPEGGSEEKPVGTVYIALASAAGCSARRFNFSGDREDIRQITAFAALDILRRHLVSGGC